MSNKKIDIGDNLLLLLLAVLWVGALLFSLYI